MKRFLLISIICSLALCQLAGCSNSNSSNSPSAEQSYSVGGENSDGDSSGTDSSNESSTQSVYEDDKGDKNSEDNNDVENSGDDESSDGELSSDGEDSDSEVGDAAQGDDEIAAAVVGSWAPYAAHKTNDPDKKVSLHSVFGDGFSFGGTLSLNPDFSFIDTTCETAVGTYSVSGNSLTLSYNSGKTVSMLLTGSADSANLECELEVDGESCTVYFTK